MTSYFGGGPYRDRELIGPKAERRAFALVLLLLCAFGALVAIGWFAVMGVVTYDIRVEKLENRCETFCGQSGWRFWRAQESHRYGYDNDDFLTCECIQEDRHIQHTFLCNTSVDQMTCVYD